MWGPEKSWIVVSVALEGNLSKSPSPAEGGGNFEKFKT
jgi:hypothetical protein